MHSRTLPPLVLPLFLTIASSLNGDSAVPRQTTPEVDAARRTGWQLAMLVIDGLEAGDNKDFPGIQTWLRDFRKATKGIDLAAPPDRWPVIDIDALVARNPNFWRAHYEIAPGDPGFMTLHAGLLLSAGEAVRASHLSIIAGQRPGIPKEMRHALQILLVNSQKAGQRSNALVGEGIKLHDKGDYAEAIKKYRDALAIWQQNGFVHYEFGLSLRDKQLIDLGEKPPSPDAIVVNAGRKNSPEVDAAFAKARKHDPFQLKAWQGDDKAVIRGFLALAKKGMPAWQQIVKDREKQVEDKVLEQVAVALQEAGVHELALAARQLQVARRGCFTPGDHPFIATGLRALVPGEPTEDLLKQLAGGKLRLRQLVAPEREAPAP